MSILSTYLKRVYSRPWMILLSVAVPALIVIASNTEGGSAGLRVALIDKDQSVLSHSVAKAIELIANFVELDEEEIDRTLAEGRIQYALVLPPGLQERVLRGERARVEAHSLQGIEITGTVTSAANAVFSAAHNIAQHVNGDADAFARALALTTNGQLKVISRDALSRHRVMTRAEAASMAQLVGLVTVAMFVTTFILSLYLLEDRKSGVLYRTLAGPVSLRRYMLETNGAFFLATALQALATVGAVAIVFPQLPTSVTLMLALVLMLCALVAVSFALAIAGISGTVRRAQLLSNMVMMPMVMLGGTSWPVEIMPPLFQRVSDFTPIRWAVDAVEEVLAGSGFPDILPHFGILLLFALVFQFLSSWRHVDIAT